MIKPNYLKKIKVILREDIHFVDNTKTDLTEDEFYSLLSWLNQFKKGDTKVTLAYISSKKCLDFSFTKPVDDNKELEVYLIDRKPNLNFDF